eukprot:CAMPEP_0119203700 /NCGR_PEP_ID=MMETSP1316-20130426/35425_1 /TAXON_ID=41880 /ORGANISM="Pycnococcus provasolii, Strain RCC2336" /LENGTH=164 /DNA_ID=CAMNT_0007199961 /DNA_START=102 /DNA_END=596 /DNA_ORIENTATION=-
MIEIVTMAASRLLALPDWRRESRDWLADVVAFDDSALLTLLAGGETFGAAGGGGGAHGDCTGSGGWVVAFAAAGGGGGGGDGGGGSGGGGGGDGSNSAVDSATSIVDLQSVRFQNGAVVMNRYMDTFPFPYYAVVRNISTLPEVVASLVQQWIELAASGGSSSA